MPFDGIRETEAAIVAAANEIQGTAADYRRSGVAIDADADLEIQSILGVQVAVKIAAHVRATIRPNNSQEVRTMSAENQAVVDQVAAKLAVETNSGTLREMLAQLMAQLGPVIGPMILQLLLGLLQPKPAPTA